MAFRIEFSHPEFFEEEAYRLLALDTHLGKFQKTIEDPRFGFFQVNQKKELIDECHKAYQQFSDRETFVHVGIGGSSLGPEMLIKSLAPLETQKRFLFINNIDPDEICEQLEGLDPKKCVFSFVSKSGGTAETNAGLAIISTWLKEQGISQSELKNYFVFTTDPQKSELLDLGKKLGITTLTIPSNIGGRFSVLTPVGLFPARFAGIPIEDLMRGAEGAKKRLLNPDLEENALLKTAGFLETLRRERQITQTVCMPYSSKLRELSFWFTQLWAESLGKERDLDGEIKNLGLTPIPAYGATDQHSQVQLFVEGPKDKCLLILEVEGFEHDYSLDSDLGNPATQKLAPFNLSQLFKGELNGTLKALKEKDRPYAKITLTQRDADNIGGIILYFESLTVLMGQLLNLNPFDQPGVEAGKRYAFEWLRGETPSQ